MIADAVAAFTSLGVQAIIYDASGIVGTDLNRRVRSLLALVIDAAALGQPVRIVFDVDETLRSLDRQHLIEAVRAANAKDLLRYNHVPFASEPALAVPDVVAWCWARGGEWRRRISSIVAEVRTL